MSEVQLAEIEEFSNNAASKVAEAINRTCNGDDGAKRSEAEELPLASER